MALSLIARTLESYDDDHLIPCYGFGDNSTRAEFIFSFYPNDQPARGLDTLLQRYRQIAPKADLSGPTSFAPLIRHAMRTVYNSETRFHILLILADGQISEGHEQETIRAIIDATKFPISIVVVGIGDGPWDMMREFDHRLPQRDWDNFHFIEFTRIIKNPSITSEERREACFALEALMELPDQCKYVHRLMDTAARENARSIAKNIPDKIVIDPPAHYI